MNLGKSDEPGRAVWLSVKKNKSRGGEGMMKIVTRKNKPPQTSAEAACKIHGCKVVCSSSSPESYNPSHKGVRQTIQVTLELDLTQVRRSQWIMTRILEPGGVRKPRGTYLRRQSSRCIVGCWKIKPYSGSARYLTCRVAKYAPEAEI